MLSSFLIRCLSFATLEPALRDHSFAPLLLTPQPRTRMNTLLADVRSVLPARCDLYRTILEQGLTIVSWSMGMMLTL